MLIFNKLKILRAQVLLMGAIKLLIFLILSGCNFEPSTQATTPLKKPLPAPNRALVKDESLVTETTRQAYQWYCAQCHGVQGYGDGVNAPHLVVPPRDHTKANYLETRSDQQLFDGIKLGGLAVGRAPCMPAWGHTINDKTIWSLVGYIRELCDCQAL